MKKVLLLMFVPLLLVDCQRQPVVSVEKTNAAKDSMLMYFQLARMGDGDAYAWLARYYRDGVEGRPDVIKMIHMDIMAEHFYAIRSMDELLKDLPADDSLRLAYEAITLFDESKDMDSIQQKAQALVDRGIPDAYQVLALVAFKNGDKAKASEYCERGLAEGSICSAIVKDFLESGAQIADVMQHPELLSKIADRFPLAYQYLGDYYAQIPHDSATDVPLAVKYYRKASENACLQRKGALWLLNTIRSKQLPTVDQLEKYRLLSLSRPEINDSMVVLY